MGSCELYYGVSYAADVYLDWADLRSPHPTMTEDLVKFVLPPEFVLARVMPSPSELLYGHRHGWIDDEGIIKIVEAGITKGVALPDSLEEVGLLLRDQHYLVPELIERAARGGSSGESSSSGVMPSRVWLYLALAWLYVKRDEFDNPFEVIEMLYADFGHPHEIDGLIRFMPWPDGEAGGVNIEERWVNYLTARDWEYSRRST